MKRIRVILSSVVYLSLAIIFWIIYGLICGSIGSIYGTFENIWFQTKQRYIRWKRFPDLEHKLAWKVHMEIQRERYRKMDETWRLNGMKMSDYTPPTPLYYLIGNTIIGILFLPYKVIYGMIVGPIVGFVNAIDGWQEVILKLPASERLDYKFKAKIGEDVAWLTKEK